MKIDDSLRLVLSFGDGLHAYHTPISRAVYEANYTIINATKATLAAHGVQYQVRSGPLIAGLTLRDVGRHEAEDRGSLDQDGNVVDAKTPAFLAELKRLTMVLCPGPSGWDLLPVDAALAQGKVDADDWSEVESAIVFFTAHALTCRKADRMIVATATAKVLDGSITSLEPMAYGASLQTSTKAESTQPPTSSIPL